MRSAERISRGIVRCYPSAWRKRYAEEVLALIDDAGSTWRHTLDLAVGCADAWGRGVLFSPPPKWEWDFLGSLLVLVVSGSLFNLFRRVGIVVPALLKDVLVGAYALLALCIFGPVLLLAFLGLDIVFRRACGQQPQPPAHPRPITDLYPTRRQVRALAVVTLVIAIGTHLSIGLFLHLPDYLAAVPFLITSRMLANIHESLVSLRVLRLLLTRRWNPHRAE